MFSAPGPSRNDLASRIEHEGQPKGAYTRMMQGADRGLAVRQGATTRSLLRAVDHPEIAHGNRQEPCSYTHDRNRQSCTVVAGVSPASVKELRPGGLPRVRFP